MDRDEITDDFDHVRLGFRFGKIEQILHALFFKIFFNYHIEK